MGVKLFFSLYFPPLFHWKVCTYGTWATKWSIIVLWTIKNPQSFYYFADSSSAHHHQTFYSSDTHGKFVIAAASNCSYADRPVEKRRKRSEAHPGPAPRDPWFTPRRRKPAAPTANMFAGGYSGLWGVHFMFACNTALCDIKGELCFAIASRSQKNNGSW